MMRIAVADDDKDAREFTVRILTEGGYHCAAFANGRDVVASLKSDTYDLLLLDWNMPGLNAIEIIEWTRTNLMDAPPVIVLTSRNEDQDIVVALESGADDFISKPSSANVIRARVAATLRRFAPQAAEARIVQRGIYTFDRLEKTVTFAGATASLTSKEFDLALLFFDNMQRPLSRSYLLQRIWNNAIDLSTRTLDMHVSKLRSKLALKPEHGHRLQTIFGYGYRLDAFDAGNEPASELQDAQSN
jgi:DNA-binding response OmpR family regulator